jgi:tRNA pseudouridine55 synthase
LTGKISQVPPAYSAKSVDGTRAYDAARRGAPLEMPAVAVTVHSWEVRDLSGEILSAVVTCSGGTYIRALARDLGRLTSSAAHLASLRRTRVGEFDVRDAATLESLSADRVRVRPLRVVADA